jgi:integrase
MKVTLRKRKSNSGNESLYLDIYRNGKREYEYLNLQLVTPTSTQDRKSNKETLQLAEAIKGQRQVELQNGTYGFNKFGIHANKDFLAYFKELTDARYNSLGNYGNWLCAYKHLKLYSNDTCLFKDVNEEFIDGFKKYLLSENLTKSKTKLSQNSALSYFNKLRAAVNEAFEKRLMEDNPAKRVKCIPQEEKSREYLSFEEVKKLSETECRYQYLKSAFLFSVLTGLRWSDINKLVWSEIHHSDKDGWSIIFRQKKTKEQEYLPMTEQARELLGVKGNPDERVFIGLKYSAYMNVELAKWMMKAGITKNITFHCARHTHATLLLSNGVDIYTVSKLLGHKHVKTTQVYGKIIDQRKIEAVNKLPKF